MKPINIYDEIAEAERELKAKQQYYPSLIAQHRIRQSVAAHRLACNQRTLQRLMEIKAKIDGQYQPSLFDEVKPTYSLEQVTMVVSHYAMTDIAPEAIIHHLNNN